MEKTVKVLLCVVIVLALLVGGMMVGLHFASDDGADWQEQFDLGMRYLSEGNYQEAILAFSAAISIDPARYEAYAARGDAYMSLGDPASAQQDYRHALDLGAQNQEELIQKLDLAQAELDGTAPTEDTADKALSLVKEYFTDGSYRRVTFYYDADGDPLRCVSSTSSYESVTEYRYDDAGNLVNIQYGGSSVPDLEYHYENGVLTGYTFYEVMGDEVLSSKVYTYERDASGNVVRITAPGSYEDMWTEAEYTYDTQGRRVSAYEHERYGDMEFERVVSYDYSYKSAVISTTQETIFGTTDTIKTILFGDLEYRPIYSKQLFDGYSIVADADGYITAVSNAEGQIVFAFEYGDASGSDPSPREITFADIPDKYIFTSGVGAWGTSLTISADGSFEGEYHDSNMGEIGQGYSATVYYCNFSGKFSNPEPVNEYVYKMTLESFQVADQEGTEYIENDTLYIASGPYGFDGPDEYYLYLPGTPDSMVPQDAFYWVKLLYGEDLAFRDVYVICSANGAYPFMGTFH